MGTYVHGISLHATMLSRLTFLLCKLECFGTHECFVSFMITFPGSALRISLSRTISVTDLNAVACTLKQDPHKTEHIKHS